MLAISYVVGRVCRFHLFLCIWSLAATFILFVDFIATLYILGIRTRITMHDEMVTIVRMSRMSAATTSMTKWEQKFAEPRGEIEKENKNLNKNNKYAECAPQRYSE